MGDVILVRHPPVARAWQKRCYGVSDPGLGRAGAADVARLVAELAALAPARVIHSGLRRARALAEPLARHLGVAAEVRGQWRERDFGGWEGQSWARIWRETGSAMDGMIDDPHHFRPGGGETTAELAARVRAALAELPWDGPVLVVTHGGPIAAARCLAAGAPLARIGEYFLPTGGIVRVLPPDPDRS